MSPPARTVLAGGTPLVVAALREALERRGHPAPAVVTTAEDLLAASAPGVVVVAASLGLGGAPVADVLPTVLLRGARVLVVCPAEHVAGVADLLMAGAAGYLSLEECDEDELSSAVTAVAEGGATLHPAVAATVLAQWRQMRASTTPSLTAKEAQVLRLLARGDQVRTIARELGLSPKTVESHRARIYTKLGARTQAQAAELAARWYLLD